MSPSSSVSFEDILWKKGKDKVIDWSKVFPKNAYPPFVNRTDLDTVSGNLTICNLTLADADEYEIESVNLRSIKFKLIVLGEYSIIGLFERADSQLFKATNAD